MLLIVIGTLTTSLALSYAWLTRIRVIRLRQFVLEMRDALFDVANGLGALDDPAYRAARSHLNAVANSVGEITFDLLLYETTVDPACGEATPPSKIPALQSAIDEKLSLCTTRIVQSLLRETFVGWVLSCRFKLRGIASVLERSVTRWCIHWVFSTAPEHVLMMNSGRGKGPLLME